VKDNARKPDNCESIVMYIYLSRRDSKGKTCVLNRRLNGFAFSARLGADRTCVVGRRYNKSSGRVESEVDGVLKVERMERDDGRDFGLVIF
jgi:hypothetical protein